MPGRIDLNFRMPFQNIYILSRQLVRRVKQVAPLLGPSGQRGVEQFLRLIPQIYKMIGEKS